MTSFCLEKKLKIFQFSYIQIAELVLGIFSVLLGIIISGIVGSNPRSAYRILYAVDPDYYEYSYYKTSTRCHWRTTYGEGIWCGLWVRILFYYCISFRFKLQPFRLKHL